MLSQSLQATLHELGVPVPDCRRVLLVDDEPDNLLVLAAVLEDDWNLSTANCGAEALDELQRRGPVDLIIADQRMPGITGIELLAQVAHLYPATMCIVLTGYTDVEPMLAAANKGLVYRFILKPYDPLEIRAVVADTLRVKAWNMALNDLVKALDQRRRELEQGARQLMLARQLLLAQERLNTLGRLVAEVGGAIRTHSSSLSVLLGLVRQTVTDPEVTATAERAWAGLDALRELLQQVRDFTQATSVKPQFGPLSARQLLERTMDAFLMEELGHRCPVHALVDPLLGVLQVDGARLQQALLALLRNAARASESGEAIHIGVRQAAGGQVIIEVKDHGRGMTEDEMLRARQPFYSGVRSGGIGLGLEIAQLGASTHQGTLDIESTRGRGTAVRITLPAGIVEGTAHGD